MKIHLLLIAFVAITFNSNAQWSLNPNINTPVCVFSAKQKDLRMETDGNGGTFIVWKDYRATNGLPDIYAQRLDSLGNIKWAMNGVPVCTQSADQSTPAIISDGKDGVIICWSDWRTSIERDIYAQRIDPNGNILWTLDGVPVANKPAREHSEKIISDDHGGFICFWEQQRSNGTWDIWSQRIDSSGNPVWANGGIPLCLVNANRRNHKAQRDGKGGAIISFQDERSGNHDIYAQRIDANGNLLWGNNAKAVCIANDAQTNAKIDPEGNLGGVYITWVDKRNGIDYDIYCQRLDSLGNLLWGPTGLPVCAASGNQSAVDIVSNNKINGVIITWKDDRNGNLDIYAQNLDPTGSPQWANNGISIGTFLGDQKNPNIVSDKDSGAIVVWEDNRNGNLDIFSQKINKNGTLAWTSQGVPICTAAGDQSTAKNVPDNKGGCVYAWEDLRNGNIDIYAHHLFQSGSANAVVDLSSIISSYMLFPNPSSDQIHLKFYLEKNTSLHFELFDLQGKLIHQFDMEKNKFYIGENTVTLETKNLNLIQGTYFLKINDGHSQQVLKLSYKP